ncbi:hypothetical protein KL939_003941 [Ogataea angusta]|nr:hypothetical protein KL939_003941 [Ogataea angusta]
MSAIDSSSVSPVGSPPEFRIHNRRGSLLDVGGENSINNFAFAVRRSVNYLSSSVGSRTTLDPECAVPGSPRVTPQLPPEEHTPLLEPPKDDVSEIVISLKSTPVQTVFNSINVLIGLGILSIPLAFRLAGWVMGTAILTLAALSTRYTARAGVCRVRTGPVRRERDDGDPVCGLVQRHFPGPLAGVLQDRAVHRAGAAERAAAANTVLSEFCRHRVHHGDFLRGAGVWADPPHVPRLAAPPSTDKPLAAVPAGPVFQSGPVSRALGRPRRVPRGVRRPETAREIHRVHVDGVLVQLLDGPRHRRRRVPHVWANRAGRGDKKYPAQ